MDFFAIVGGHQGGIFRLELERGLQDKLTEAFYDQANVLYDPALVVVPFARETFHPDETEVLEIAPFDLPAEIYESTENPVGWPTLPTNDEAVSRVYSVFGYDRDDDKLIFQVIQKAQRISRVGWNLILSSGTFSKLESPGLILGETCHAVYQGGALRFKSIWWLKQIIDISSYYRAATEADIDNLAALPNVQVENLTALKEGSGQWVRSRVAYILDSKVLEAYTPMQLSKKAEEFNLKLETVGEGDEARLVLPEDRKRLRAVLKFLEEEYYSGPITGAAYEANSKRRI